VLTNYLRCSMLVVMDTLKAIKLAGGVRPLALLLGVTTQAVYAWGDRMPPLQVYRLKDLKPKWFRKEKL